MEAVHHPGQDVREQTSLERDARWLLAKRIARSGSFTRSDRLSRLLLYVCKMHINGRDDEINEQRIGIEVFRRPPSFDSGADSIVRSHATRLRHRLQTYFETEGAQELLRIEIPRGGYVPRFIAVEQERADQELPAPSLQNPSDTELPGSTSSSIAEPFLGSAPARTESKQRSWTGPFLRGIVFSLLVMAAITYLSRNAARFSPNAPVLEQTKIEKRFWADLFNDGHRTLVVTGDSGLVLYETFAKREVSLPDYIAGTYRAPGHPSDAQALERDFATRRYTSLADLSLSLRLSHLPQWSDDHAQVVFARDLRSADAANSNLILIGSRQANPWVSLVDTTMNFVLTPDGAGHFYFVNRHPAPNEQAKYIPSEPGSGTADSSVYALICYRPNSPGMGKVLLLSGLWMSGTEAAGNFILTHQQFSSFLSAIAKPDGSIPPFELLVQIRSLAGNAVSSSIVARRIGSLT